MQGILYVVGVAGKGDVVIGVIFVAGVYVIAGVVASFVGVVGVCTPQLNYFSGWVKGGWWNET